MTSRPILFSPPMVLANLSGIKNQTRRTARLNASGRVEKGGHNWHVADPDAIQASPYGIPGDRLWVREEHYQFGHWQPVEGKLTKGGKQKWAFIAHPDSAPTFTPPATYRKGRHHKDPAKRAWHKRLARFMPRAFSRTTLEITGVRIERLQQIAAADVLAEGITLPRHERKLVHRLTGKFRPCDYWPVRTWEEMKALPDLEDHLLRAEYAALWETLNGAGSWAANPLIWVVSYQMLPLPCKAESP